MVLLYKYVWLAAVHTPGKNNETADYMPRLQNENTESGDYHQLSFKGFLKFFTILWSELNFYAFYPFSLIRAAIAKVRTKKCSGIMIIPWWKTQFWFPLMVSLLKNFLIYTSFSDHTDFTIQKISRKTPTLSINEIISYSLIRENSRNTNFSREIMDVVTDSQRTTTQSQYKSVLR